MPNPPLSIIIRDVLKDNNGFGPHLMIDLNECDSKKLDNLDLCFSFLDDLPDLIHMTKITQPHVFRYSGLVPEDKGITGMVIIAESHITIHTFPLKEYAFIDIFSCKPFDTDRALQHAIQLFGSKDPIHFIQGRGEKFPRDSFQPKVVLHKERVFAAS